MADKKITGFTADVTPADADLVVTAKSPFGSGSNRKVTLADIQAFVLTEDSANITLSTTTSGNVLLSPATNNDIVDINGFIDADTVFSSPVSGFASFVFTASGSSINTSSSGSRAMDITFLNTGADTVTETIQGVKIVNRKSGTGTNTLMVASEISIENTSTGTITTGVNDSVNFINSGGGTFTNGVATYLVNNTGVTNNYIYKLDASSDWLTDSRALSLLDNATVKYLPLSIQSGGMSANRTAVADSDYSALVTDYLIAYSSISVARTVTLPTVASTGGTATDVFRMVIKNESGSVFNIIVDGNGAETIDGAANQTMTGAYDSLSIYTNGTAWFIE